MSPIQLLSSSSCKIRRGGGGSIISSCTLLLLATLLTASSSSEGETGKSKSIYDFTVNDIKGSPVDLGKYRGKALLILNTASQCGHTDAHLKALKRLHEILSYENRFEILAFPCNDFGEQEPWEATEIEEFVKTHHKCEFPLMEKVKVTGKGANEFWRFLIDSTQISPTWNFQKYLYDSNGKFVKSWDANTSIESIFDDIKAVVDKVKVDTKGKDDGDDEGENANDDDVNKVEL
jgi:glutathione peroxidase